MSASSLITDIGRAMDEPNWHLRALCHLTASMDDGVFVRAGRGDVAGSTKRRRELQMAYMMTSALLGLDLKALDRLLLAVRVRP